MNPRIRELADQAELTIRTSTGTYMSHPEFNKKFAELIVRECAQLARDTNLEDVEGGDNDVLRAAKQQILEHFGVE
jgi:hypothetical protein